MLWKTFRKCTSYPPNCCRLKCLDFEVKFRKLLEEVTVSQLGLKYWRGGYSSHLIYYTKNKPWRRCPLTPPNVYSLKNIFKNIQKINCKYLSTRVFFTIIIYIYIIAVCWVHIHCKMMYILIIIQMYQPKSFY